MSILFDLMRTYSAEILLIAVFLSAVSLLLVILNYRRTSKIIRKYRQLMRGANNKNLESMLYNQLETIENNLAKTRELELFCSSLSSRLDLCLQHVGVVRYNAFDNMGGDQSFSIALLDEDGDGLVLTGLYGRDATTCFAKPVKNSKSTYPLSDEEEEAIEKAFR